MSNNFELSKSFNFLIIKQKSEELYFSVLEIENFVKNLPTMLTETNFIFQKIQEIKLLFLDGHKTGFLLLAESPKKKVLIFENHYLFLN